MIYIQDYKDNRFFYDSTETNLKLAIWVEGPEGLKEMVEVMLKAPKFMGRDRKLHETDKERELFFIEYIPRVFGFPSNIEKYKKIEDIPKRGNIK